MDILFSINLAFSIGDYQRTLNEGSVLLNGDQLDNEQEAKVFSCMWRSAIAMGEQNPLPKVAPYKKVLDDNKALKEVLQLLSIVSLKKRTDSHFSPTEFIEKADNVAAQSESCTVRYLAAHVLYECSALQKSFDLVRRQSDLDSQLLIVCVLMAINRPDAANVRLEELKQKFGEDARLQLVEAAHVRLWESVLLYSLIHPGGKRGQRCPVHFPGAGSGQRPNRKALASSGVVLGETRQI